MLKAMYCRTSLEAHESGGEAGSAAGAVFLPLPV